MLLNFFFADLQTLPKCIRLYGGLNISRIKFLLITPKTAKSTKNFPLEIFRLYGTVLQSIDILQSTVTRNTEYTP